MEINWKEVSASPGYKSLKKALIKDVVKATQSKYPTRRKEEFYALFNWVIARAKHYAYRKHKPIEEILNIWEAERDYWWLNYYKEYMQPKLPSGKPRNVKRISEEKYIRRIHKRKPTLLNELRRVRNKKARDVRLPKLPRWGSRLKRMRHKRSL